MNSVIVSKWILRSTVAAIALLPAGAFGQSAQAAQASSGDQLEEIVVTARKREEVIQKTPVSITAFTAKDLQYQTVHEVKDLEQQTPSLQLTKNGSNPQGLYISMRGQVETTTGVDDPASIGVYIDDVYDTGRITSSLKALIDLERIEVLKGPQGTLYGRNTTGGAIKFVTKLPTNDYEGSLMLGLGNYDRHVVNGVINIPIVDNKVALRLVGVYDTHSGYSYDIVNHHDLDDQNNHSVRGALKIDPTDNFDLVLRGNFGAGRNGGLYEPMLYLQPGITTGSINFEVVAGLITPQTGLAALGGNAAARATVTSFLPTVNALFQQALNTPRDRISQTKGFSQGARGQDEGGSITMTYDLDSVVFKSITALARSSSHRTFEVGGGPYVPLYTTQDGAITEVTQEFQVSGTGLDNDRLKYTAGVYYYYGTAIDDRVGKSFVLFLIPLGATPITYPHNIFQDEALGTYAQATYALTDNVNFTAGVRWTTESKTENSTVVNQNAVTGALSCGGPAPTTAATPIAQCFGIAGHSDRNTSYTVGLDWSVTDDILLYAKTSRGFKSGGLSPYPAAGQPFAVYNPEIVTDYEGGIKSQWFDNRFRANATIYHSDYDNIQRTIAVLQSNGLIVTPTQNAAAATIDGAEFETEVIPVTGLKLTANAAYTYPKYLRYTQKTLNLTLFPSGIQDLSGEPFQSLSRWTFGLTAGYDYPVEIGSLHLQASYAYRTKADTFVADSVPATSATSSFAATAPASATYQPGYGVVNASVTLDLDQYNASIMVWGKNITDQKYLNSTTSLVNAGVGSTYGFYGDPATFGVDLTKRF